MIPVDTLINGRTIVQRERASRSNTGTSSSTATILLMAEGLACESYLDTGNRIGFGNGGVSRDSKHWSQTCLPHTSRPARWSRRPKRLCSNRPSRLSFPVTFDPDLHIVADGQRIDAMPLGDKRYLFVLPAERDAQLRCARRVFFAPCETIAFNGDNRVLGVCVTRLQIDGDDLPLDSALASGWHAPQSATNEGCSAGRTAQRLLPAKAARRAARYWGSRPILRGKTRQRQSSA